MTGNILFILTHERQKKHTACPDRALLIITVDKLDEKGYIPHKKGLNPYLAS
jgi:hypothetical protein